MAKRFLIPLKCKRCDGVAHVEYREPTQDRSWTTFGCKNSEKPIYKIQNDNTQNKKSFRIWDVIEGKYVLGDKRKFESNKDFENWVSKRGGRWIED